LSYSRQGIFLYRDPLTTLLKSRGFVPLKEAAASPANVLSITRDRVMSSFEQTPERSPIDNR